MTYKDYKILITVTCLHGMICALHNVIIFNYLADSILQGAEQQQSLNGHKKEDSFWRKTWKDI